MKFVSTVRAFIARRAAVRLASIKRHAARYRAEQAERRARNRRPVYRGAGPSGTSWRQLKRAHARGYRLATPSLQAKLRHRWFQKEVFFAALRLKMKVGTPADGRLVGAVGKALQERRA